MHCNSLNPVFLLCYLPPLQEPLGADKCLFTIETLDEFEASLPKKRIRSRGKVGSSLFYDDD